MTWLGVGNVEGRVLSGDPSTTRPKGSLALERGVPGHELPTVRTATLCRATRAMSWSSPPMGSRRPSPTRWTSPARPQAISERIVADSLEARRRRPRGGSPLPGRAADERRRQPGANLSQRAYTSALADYLHDPTETALRVAYELGREAVSRELSVLDLAVTHQQALSAVLADTRPGRSCSRPRAAAGDFFLESLSIFEMVQRGFKEARQAFLARAPPDRALTSALDVSHRRLARPRGL